MPVKCRTPKFEILPAEGHFTRLKKRKRFLQDKRIFTDFGLIFLENKRIFAKSVRDFLGVKRPSLPAALFDVC